MDNLELVRQHVSKANGLPNEHYITQSMFDEEKNSIIFNQWAGLDVCSEIPKIGDAKPLNFMGLPLFIIRDTQNAVRVYQNTCRHRGMILVDKPKKIQGAIRCPYHSWCYSTEGQLVSTPHIGGPGQNTDKNIDRSKLSLIEIRSHIWRDVIFVNPDGMAPPFEEVHQPLLDRWSVFEQPMYSDMSDSSFKLEVNGNWKLAVENYLESYHLPWVHPGLNSYSKLEDHENIVEYGHYSGQISHKYIPQYTTGKQFADFNNLGPEWDTKGEYIVLFPNLVLGVQKDHIFNLIIEPLAPNKIREHIELYYSDPAMLADEYKETRQENAKLWKNVFEEDIFVVEGMQKGRYAKGFDGGRFSPIMDEPTHVFHDWYARKILNSF